MTITDEEWAAAKPEWERVVAHWKERAEAAERELAEERGKRTAAETIARDLHWALVTICGEAQCGSDIEERARAALALYQGFWTKWSPGVSPVSGHPR